MKFFSQILVVATTILSVEACKCVNPNGGANDIGETSFCCGQQGGTFIDGVDCNAGSISNRLSNFENCCHGGGDNSDCSCPTCNEDGLDTVASITTLLA